MEILQNFSILEQIQSNQGLVIGATALAAIASLARFIKKLAFFAMVGAGAPLAYSLQSQSDSLVQSPVDAPIALLISFFALGLIFSRPLQNGVGGIYKFCCYISIGSVAVLSAYATFGKQLVLLSFSINPQVSAYCALSFLCAAFLVALLKALAKLVPVVFWASSAALLFLVISPGFPQQIASKIKLDAATLQKIDVTVVNELLPQLIDFFSSLPSN